MSNNSTSNSGISVIGLLGVVFITLRLCGVIHWSWWWVLAPFWGSVAFILAFLLILFIIAFAASILKSIAKSS